MIMGEQDFKCEDFIEYLGYEFFEGLYEDRSGMFPSDSYFERMTDAAKREGKTLTDVEDFDYDRHFYNLYKCGCL